MTAFEKLKVWEKGIALTQEIYAVSRKLPPDERFGMTTQLRRAVTSIMANLAEGCGRYTYPDKAAKFVIARGECSEVRAFLLIAVALDYLEPKTIQRSLMMESEMARMLSGLIAACRLRH